MTRSAFIAIPRRLATAGAVCALLAAGACDHMNRTQQRTLSGGALGAAGGAAIGALTGGSAALGAIIGGGAGAAGGYITSQHGDRR